MKRPDLGDSDLGDLGTEYATLAPQRQWAAMDPDDRGPWWSDVVLWLLILLLGAAAGAALYVWLWGWS